MGDDAFDAAGTDGPAGLAEFLGDDIGGGVGVEEAVADDLADDFIGAAVEAFGAAFLAEQGGGAAVGERLAELEVALLAQAELACGGGGAEALALAFDEHREFAGDLVVGPEGAGAGGADEELLLEIGVEHGGTCTGWESEENRTEQDNAGRRRSLIKYGGKKDTKRPVVRNKMQKQGEQWVRGGTQTAIFN